MATSSATSTGRRGRVARRRRLWPGTHTPRRQPVRASLGGVRIRLCRSAQGAPIGVTRAITSDLPLPATAEIVLEGEVPPPNVETRPEGPFGEWSGYYAKGVSDQPVVRVKAVLHRDSPIILGCPSARNPALWSLGRHIQLCAGLWDDLDSQVPGSEGGVELPGRRHPRHYCRLAPADVWRHARQAAGIVASSQQGRDRREIRGRR